MQGNLATAYDKCGRLESALQMKRDVYYGTLKILGEKHQQTLIAACNYAVTLKDLNRFKEAERVLRKMVPVARRVRGEGDVITLKMRLLYAQTLYADPGATLDDIREAVATVEEMERTARRVLGGSQPTTKELGRALRKSRATLATREKEGS